MKEKKFKVLIVDDQKSNLDVLIHILKDDFAVYPAKSGEGALKKAAEVSPDLILLDIILPDMDGFEVLEKLKSDDLTEHIPVIFITGLSNEEDEKRGLRLGAADYITKPFSHELVKARVSTQFQIIKHKYAVEELGTIDELTGMPNRKSFDHQLNVEWARAIREKNPVSLLMIDIDDFAVYKEKYGLEYADSLLKRTAGVIQTRLKRMTDVTTRYSSNVFAVILPNTPTDGAVKVAEDVIIGAQHSEDPEGKKITLCIGVSEVQPGNDDSLSYFVLQAERNLFRARAAGNIVCY